MDYSRSRKGVHQREQPELLPRDASFAASPAEPVSPGSVHYIVYPFQPPIVTSDAIILVVPIQFQLQHLVLLANRLMPVGPTPLPDRFQRSPQAFIRCLLLDDPVPPP